MNFSFKWAVRLHILKVGDPKCMKLCSVIYSYFVFITTECEFVYNIHTRFSMCIVPINNKQFNVFFYFSPKDFFSSLPQQFLFSMKPHTHPSNTTSGFWDSQRPPCLFSIGRKTLKIINKYEGNKSLKYFVFYFIHLPCDF